MDETTILLGSDDIAFGFALSETQVRGQIVRLGPATADEIISRHVLPNQISKILGETLALSAIIGASLKFDGKIIIELRAEADNNNLPVKFIVAEYHTSGAMRAMAKINSEHFANSDTFYEFENLFGDGVLLVTIDQENSNERYQGQVAIKGESLSFIAQEYFEKSEQISTKIHLACNLDKNSTSHNQWRACGIMIQKIGFDETRTDAAELWNEASIKFDTLTDDEILDPEIGAGELLYRLYHENEVASFTPKLLIAKCNCSYKKLVSIMKQFAKEEAETMQEQDGKIHARCEFCNTTYKIDFKEI